MRSYALIIALGKGGPCDISNERESLTTDVQRRLRSLDAVSNCFPSLP